MRVITASITVCTVLCRVVRGDAVSGRHWMIGDNEFDCVQRDGANTQQLRTLTP